MPRLWLRKLTSIGAVPEGDNPPAEILLYKRKGADLAEDTVNEIEAVEEPVEPVEPVEAAAPEGDEIAKRIAQAEEEIQKARDERDAAIQALAGEVAKRRLADFTAKAEQLETLLGPAGEVAPILDALEAASPDAYVELEKRLTVALGRVALTRELGAAEGQADPITRRDAWVRKFLGDHPEQTETTARALFWKTNPDALEALRKDES